MTTLFVLFAMFFLVIVFALATKKIFIAHEKTFENL
jgi:hypothetical protein